MNIFDIQSLNSFYHAQSALRKTTYKKQSQYIVYSFSRQITKNKKSHSFYELKPALPEQRSHNQSCHCNDCGGKIHKKLLQQFDSLYEKEEHSIKLKPLELEKSQKSYEIKIRSSEKQSLNPTPQNKQTRTKFKPMSRVLQMVHVKSMISKLMLNSQPIKKPFFQSSPNTVSDFGSKSQYLQVPEPKEIQSPLTQLRMKTEPSPCQLQVHFAIDKNNFYYPRVSRISQLGIVSLLNISEGLENKNSKKLAPILTNRYKSPEKEKIRTLSQRVQSTYFRKSNSKVKDSVKKLL